MGGIEVSRQVELGAGFAFVGRQVYLEVGGGDFFIDLLIRDIELTVL